MKWKVYQTKAGNYWEWKNRNGFWARIYEEAEGFSWYLAKGEGNPFQAVSPMIIEGKTKFLASAKVAVELAYDSQPK